MFVSLAHVLIFNRDCLSVSSSVIRRLLVPFSSVICPLLALSCVGSG